jgi:hypothetical protein
MSHNKQPEKRSGNPKRERGRALPPSLTLRVTFKATRVEYKV